MLPTDAVDRIYDRCAGSAPGCDPTGRHEVALYFYRKVDGGDGVRRVGAYCFGFAASISPAFEVQLIEQPPNHLIADLVALALAS